MSEPLTLTVRTDRCGPHQQSTARERLDCAWCRERRHGCDHGYLDPDAWEPPHAATERAVHRSYVDGDDPLTEYAWERWRSELRAWLDSKSAVCRLSFETGAALAQQARQLSENEVLSIQRMRWRATGPKGELVSEDRSLAEDDARAARHTLPLYDPDEHGVDRAQR